MYVSLKHVCRKPGADDMLQQIGLFRSGAHRTCLFEILISLRLCVFSILFFFFFANTIVLKDHYERAHCVCLRAGLMLQLRYYRALIVGSGITPFETSKHRCAPSR